MGRRGSVRWVIKLVMLSLLFSDRTVFPEVIISSISTCTLSTSSEFQINCSPRSGGLGSVFGATTEEDECYDAVANEEEGADRDEGDYSSGESA